MNVIHYMHDKQGEAREMALHDYAPPARWLRHGRLPVVADSLAAIGRQGEGRSRRDRAHHRYQTEGTFPVFGNNDNRVDQICRLVSTFMSSCASIRPIARPCTQSILTITSNVAARRPGIRLTGDVGASCSRLAPTRCTAGTATVSRRRGLGSKIPYRDAADGISSPPPSSRPTWARGRGSHHQPPAISTHFGSTGYHMNVNVLNRDTLIDAMDHPEKYPSLTIRVSGYAVNFVRLTREQQMDVIYRTFHVDGLA
jgi:formate C-acetyltransferase